MKYKNNGFSLLEIIVVMVIISILAIVATPRYRSATDQTKTMEAKYGLADFYRHQKSYFIENGYYGETVEDIGFELKSKNYVIGFQNSSNGATDIETKPGKNCKRDAGEMKFIAGSANKNNRLNNYSIDEQNCINKLPKGSSNCPAETDNQRCIEN